MKAYERALAELDGRAHCTVNLGQYGERYTAHLHLSAGPRIGPPEVGPAYIDAIFHGSTIATILPHRVTLYSAGWGHSPATRAALSWVVTGGNASVYSRLRKLWVLGHPFREGITLDDDDPHKAPIFAGRGDQVDGAAPRRRRDGKGVLR